MIICPTVEQYISRRCFATKMQREQQYMSVLGRTGLHAYGPIYIAYHQVEHSAQGTLKVSGAAKVTWPQVL